MPSITKRFVDASSFVYESLLHVFLRDFTNYYWHKEQHQRLTETYNTQTNDEGLNNSNIFETEGSYSSTRESIGADTNIEENQINEEGSDEIGDKSTNEKNCNSPTSIKEEIRIENLGDCIQKDDLENNYLKEPYYNKEKIFKILHSEDFGSYLSESPIELKTTSLKKNLSYTVVAQKSDGDSLTYKILNNENYLGDNTIANPPSSSGGILEKQNSTQKNLTPHLENEYDSHNDSTICFRDVSQGTTKIAICVSESTPVDEELLPKDGTTDPNHTVIQNSIFNAQNEEHATLKTKSTESLTIGTGRQTDEPKPCEETFSLDNAWNIGVVQEKIQNLLSALTSNVIESSPDENVEPTQKLSDTSYYDSDNVSDTESYDELVKKVLSGTKSDGEMSHTEDGCCMCMEKQTCLQVVEFDEADELLTTGQMSSVDTGSVSDWLYSVPPAICLPSTNGSTTNSSEDTQRIKDNDILANSKHSKYQEEIIARTLFTHKWVGDTKKYCTS